MSVRFWKQVTNTLRRLSPESIRREADRPFSLAVVAAPHELQLWSAQLVPAEQTERKRDQALKRLFTISVPLSEAYARMIPQFDIALVTPSAAAEVRASTRDYFLLPANPDGDDRWAAELMDEVRERRPELRLALARHYWPLRNAAVEQIIRTVARENAAFAIFSALPNVIPSPLELPWAIGEFASDTAFITANQLRMAFMIAAASDSPVGWRQQKGQLASLVGSAFGWRALARELAGKAPAGGGLLAKALIAYAATHAIGRGLEQFHRLGRHFTRAEKTQAYEQALRSGREIVRGLARKTLARRHPRPA